MPRKRQGFQQFDPTREHHALAQETAASFTQPMRGEMATISGRFSVHVRLEQSLAACGAKSAYQGQLL